MTDIAELAAAAGILPCYRDMTGAERRCSPDTARAILQAMGFSVETDSSVRDALHALSARPGLPAAIVIRLGAQAPPRLPGNGHWTLQEEDGGVHEGMAHGGIDLPPGLAPGYHKLTIADAESARESTIIAAPPACYMPDALTGGGRRWGVACHVYSLRSASDWGIGTFSELAALAEMTAAAGGSTLAINPLHARFSEKPDLCSPYWPSSRRFLDPVYIDLAGVAELKACTDARALLRASGLPERIAAAKGSREVDYKAVTCLKLELLRPLVRRWEAQPWPELDDFVAAGGEDLHRFAVFSALSEHFGGKPWRQWPAVFRDPASASVARWAESHRRDIRFHLLLQWLAERQLAASAAVPLEIGLLRDLAVGVSPDGADAWADQALYPGDTRVGAPPDMFSTEGQDWGLPPLNPHLLASGGYRPFIAAIRANMAHAGGLRIDHVMSLDRLFWIPAGAKAIDGAYVRYPFEDLLGIIALESHRAGCLVVGEDLGTVPDGFRARLARENLLSTRILFFERHESKLFKRPELYPALALAVASTHDMPTLAGYWAGRDIAIRAEISGDSAEEEAVEREHDRQRLLDALHDQGLLLPEAKVEDIILAVHRFLARTPSQLMLVNVADIMGAIDQLNLPGTVNEHPNWRHKLPATLEELRDSVAWARTIEAVARERG